MSRGDDIAIEITAAITGAIRSTFVQIDREEIKEPRVYVIFTGVAKELHSRGEWQEVYGISVLVARPVSNNDIQATIDAGNAKAEEIDDTLVAAETMAGADLIAYVRDPLFDEQILAENRIFETVTTYSYVFYKDN